MPATIELRTRDIKGAPYVPLLGTPQHGYFIHTMADRQNIHIVRAGPTNDDMMRGDLHVDYVAYNSGIQGAARNDWINDPTQYRTVTLYNGDDVTARNYMNKIWEVGLKINQQSPDYKLPVCDIINFGIYNKCSQGNSNTFIQKALEHAKLPMKMPQHPDGTVAWLPGLKSEIRDTLVDHIAEYGGKFSDLTLAQAQALYAKYVEARTGAAQKFMGAYKVAETMYAFTKKSDELLKIYADFAKWQKEKLEAIDKGSEDQRQALEAQANAECKAKGVAVEQDSSSCGPGTPGAVETHVDVVTHYTPNFCGPRVIFCPPNSHTIRTHHWHCNIKVPCGDIQAKYQAILDASKAEKTQGYQAEKAEKEKQINKMVEAIMGTIDKTQATNDMYDTYNDLRTEMLGELNVVKGSLCDAYGISHESFV